MSQLIFDKYEVIRRLAVGGMGEIFLARQHGMVASFSRALVEGLTAQLSDAEFDAALDTSIESIFEASRT